MTSRLTHLQCERCGAEHDAFIVQHRCRCGGTLLARYDLSDLDLAGLRARPGGPWRYRELLPVQEEPVSLGEPETPLLFAPKLSEEWGVEVFIKDESSLPGGTFKARGATVGLSRAVELGVKEVVMPTAGNAGGTWALYAARAGVDITVVMATSAPRTNQAEVTAAGGRLELVEGSLAEAGARARAIADESGAFFAGVLRAVPGRRQEDRVVGDLRRVRRRGGVSVPGHDRAPGRRGSGSRRCRESGRRSAGTGLV